MKIYTLFVAALAVLAFVACDKEKDSLYPQLPIDLIGGISDFEGDTVDVMHYQSTNNDSGLRVITNTSELKQVFPEGVPDVDIDFNTNNAVFIAGISNYGVSFVKVRLDQVDDSYTLRFAVQQNMLCVIEHWCALVPVPKDVTNDNLKYDAVYYKPF